jgi:cytochrome bd-type quinol oxidase subunit 1
VAGFVLTVASGTLFVLTEPDQYIYNPAFHLKLMFMVVAGMNASAFYVTSYRKTTARGAPDEAPRLAKLIAVASLSLWIGVIVAGRLITFYRPFPCGPEGPGFLAECLPDYYR